MSNDDLTEEQKAMAWDILWEASVEAIAEKGNEASMAVHIFGLMEKAKESSIKVLGQ